MPKIELASVACLPSSNYSNMRTRCNLLNYLNLNSQVWFWTRIRTVLFSIDLLIYISVVPFWNCAALFFYPVLVSDYIFILLPTLAIWHSLSLYSILMIRILSWAIKEFDWKWRLCFCSLFNEIILHNFLTILFGSARAMLNSMQLARKHVEFGRNSASLFVRD